MVRFGVLVWFCLEYLPCLEIDLDDHFRQRSLDVDDWSLLSLWFVFEGWFSFFDLFFGKIFLLLGLGTDLLDVTRLRC